MAYVMIAVVLLLILVPMMSVLPSKRQRARMAMRQVARAAGISVELTTIDTAGDPHVSSGLKVVAWRCQRRRAQDWRRLPQVAWCLRKSRSAPGQTSPEARWVWVDVGPAAGDLPTTSTHLSAALRTWLETQVPLLPGDVEQVEEAGYNVAVYWHEREPGTETQVIDFLKNCTEMPLQEPLHTLGQTAVPAAPQTPVSGRKTS